MDRVRQGQRATAEVLQIRDQLREALAGDDLTINAEGVFRSPGRAKAMLKGMRETLDRAIDIHAGCSWPSDEDYDLPRHDNDDAAKR